MHIIVTGGGTVSFSRIATGMAEEVFRKEVQCCV